MKKILFAVFLALALSVASYSVVAPKAVAAVSKQQRIGVKADYATLKNTVTILFYNLQKVKKVSYTLTYTFKGVPQGVIGSFDVTKHTSGARKIFLGTCSQYSCVLHANATNLTLSVTTTYISGDVVTQNYPIEQK